MTFFLGTRECQGYVEPCAFGEGTGFYDEYGELEFGLMFHGYDYPNETGIPELWRRLWRAKMDNGVIVFPSPVACPPEWREFVRPMQPTPFIDNRNCLPVDDDMSLRQLLDGKEP